MCLPNTFLPPTNWTVWVFLLLLLLCFFYFVLLPVCSEILDEFGWDWDLGKETPRRCTEREKSGIFGDFQGRRSPALGILPWGPVPRPVISGGICQKTELVLAALHSPPPSNLTSLLPGS